MSLGIGICGGLTAAIALANDGHAVTVHEQAHALDGVGPANAPAALRACEDARRDRTARVRLGSLANDWTEGQGKADSVYGQDAWAPPFGEPTVADR